MKHKSLSQMNKEKQLKPMTKEEEYRNADVPMPKDEEDDYNGGKAYYKFLEFFFKNKRDEDDKK
tara:strand:- start:541 stop:732 length:192 start_codon:yes stop_codon:yes gene_type:complete